MPKARRCAIYCRLSRNRTGGLSVQVQRQEEACRKLAKARGWTVAFVAVDDDVSAYSGKKRPGYDRVLEAIESGAVDVVLAWDPDRLHRRPIELERFMDLVEPRGVEVVTVNAGTLDLTSAAGRANARMQGTFARFESEHRSDRTKAAHEQIAAEGRFHGGRRPYGYKPLPDGSMRVVQREAAIIREAHRRVLDYERVGTIAADLNRRGIATVTGAKWSTPTLRRIVSSPTVAGRRMSGGVDVGPAQWEAILSVEDVAAAAAILDQGPKRGRVPRLALLSGGRLVCSCGQAMRSARHHGGQRMYRCMGCFQQAMAEPVEQIVEAALLDWYASRPAVVELAPEPPDEVEAELVLLSSDYGSGLITRPEWQARREQLMARRRPVDQSSRAQARAVAALGAKSPVEAWAVADLAARQAMLDPVIGSVVLTRPERRGPKFDETRVQVLWT